MTSKVAAVIFSAVLFLSFTTTSYAADKVLVSIYHVATGKHHDFLKWQAKRDAVARELGLPMDQWYAHSDGASWDYLVISSMSDAQNEKLDARLAEKGMSTGFKVGLELRQFISKHTDTYAVGPVSVGELAKMAE